ncbi:MAG: PHP domain-containing protein, partial [Planctomycetales bacterium]|nr:PHP domain-containing protein [Planctomycetales bacterium]
MRYSELHCKTNYSFLLGASHPDELVDRAVELGYHALAVTDDHSLAGVVRAFAAARLTKLKLIIGAEITPNDAPPLVLWATDRVAYGRLSRLITVGRRRAPKGQCWLSFSDIQTHSQGLLAGIVPMLRGDRSRTAHID